MKWNFFSGKIVPTLLYFRHITFHTKRNYLQNLYSQRSSNHYFQSPSPFSDSKCYYPIRKFLLLYSLNEGSVITGWFRKSTCTAELLIPFKKNDREFQSDPDSRHVTMHWWSGVVGITDVVGEADCTVWNNDEDLD